MTVILVLATSNFHVQHVAPYYCYCCCCCFIIIIVVVVVVDVVVVVVVVEFLTSQLWLGNIDLSWDVVINRIRLGGIIIIII